MVIVNTANGLRKQKLLLFLEILTVGTVKNLDALKMNLEHLL